MAKGYMRDNKSKKMSVDMKCKGCNKRFSNLTDANMHERLMTQGIHPRGEHKVYAVAPDKVINHQSQHVRGDHNDTP